MDENNLNYSDAWQKYLGGYDKFEYDIKLKDGTVVENCFPNDDLFVDLKTKLQYSGSNIAEIRFSQNPVTVLNLDVSSAKFTDENNEDFYNETEEMDDNEQQSPLRNKRNIFGLHAMLGLTAPLLHTLPDHDFYLPKQKTIKGTRISVRTEPKIPRNSICPKCNSGKKYKKCCEKNKPSNED